MEIKEMSMKDIENRSAELEEMLKAEDADVDALTKETEELEARKAEILKEAEERANELKNIEIKEEMVVEEERKEMTNMEVRNTQEYINAYARYIRTGDDKECRSLLTENVNGMIPVPEFVYGIIAKRLEESEILRRVRRMNAKGNVKVGFEYNAPLAVKHTEGGEAVTEEQLQLGIVNLIPTTWKKWVAVSDEALDMQTGEELLTYIYDEVARGIIGARENEVVAKILAAPQTADATHPSVAKTGEAAGTITDFVDARALLSSAARDLVVIVTPAQYAQYRGMQMGATYNVDPFDGLPVLFNDTVTAPIIGDLSGVMEVLPNNEIQFKFDDKTNMTEDLVRILGRQPSAIEVVADKFFAKVAE